MGRGKIERETKREKQRFSLGRNARRTRVPAFEKTRRVCARAKKEEASPERKKKIK